MKKFLLGMTVAATLLATCGLATAQTIKEIQYYDPITGEPQSPHDGQIVTVTGTVYVVRGTYNAGTYYIQGATGGIQFYIPIGDTYPEPDFDFPIGTDLQVTGTVGDFGGEIQIINIDPDTGITVVGTSPEPTPQVLTPDQVIATWENVGNFVSVTGTVGTVSSNSFTLETSTDPLNVYIDGDTGINISSVNPGDLYQVISPCTNFATFDDPPLHLIQLKPRMQADLIDNPGGDASPIIHDVGPENWIMYEDVPNEIWAHITDDNGVVSATIEYRDSDGENPGSWQTAIMTADADDIWRGTIPAPHTSAQVDYYITASDGVNDPSTYPGGAPDFFYSLAVGFTSIYDIQYVDIGGDNFDSPLVDRVVNVRGVVTIGSDEFGGDTLRRFVIQEEEKGPDGTYRWGGVLVYDSSNSNLVYRGQIVEIAVRVDEYFGMTELNPRVGEAVYPAGWADDLPRPMKVTTAILASYAEGEAYEGCYVKTFGSRVMAEENELLQFPVSDTGEAMDALTVYPTTDLTYLPTVGDMVHVESYMDYYDDTQQRSIRPTSDAWVTILIGVTDVDDTPTLVTAGGFVSVAPNPFNPQTKISFVVGQDGPTQLDVYDIRGVRVRTLVQGHLSADTYEVSWDGRSDNGEQLASGNYFARLRIGYDVSEVRKLMLVK